MLSDFSVKYCIVYGQVFVNKNITVSFLHTRRGHASTDNSKASVGRESETTLRLCDRDALSSAANISDTLSTLTQKLAHCNIQTIAAVPTVPLLLLL